MVVSLFAKIEYFYVNKPYPFYKYLLSGFPIESLNSYGLLLMLFFMMGKNIFVMYYSSLMKYFINKKLWYELL